MARKAPCASNARRRNNRRQRLEARGSERKPRERLALTLRFHAPINFGILCVYIVAKENDESSTNNIPAGSADALLDDGGLVLRRAKRHDRRTWNRNLHQCVRLFLLR